MSFQRSRLLGVIVLTSVFVAGSEARADQQACARSYDAAQVLKKNGAYLSARKELVVCVRECPAAIERVCTEWFDGLERLVPSVVVHAQANGEDRSDVKIDMDGKPLVEKIDGRAIEVDPGQHDFTFTLGGYPPVKKHVVLHEAEQLRVVNVTFERPEVAQPAPKPVVTRPVEFHRPVPTLVYVSGGVAVVAAAGVAGFGLSAIAQRDRFEAICSPNCSDRRVDALHNNLVWTNISIGVGLAALTTGEILWVTRPTVPVRTERAAFGVAPLPSGGLASASFTF